MRKWFRPIKGVLGMGGTWAMGWIPIGSVTGVAVGLGFGFSLSAVVINYSLMFGVLGFLSGSIFSTVVSLSEGRRSFDELSLPRFAVWGGVGGFILAASAVGLGIVGLGFSPLGWGVVGVLTVLGSASATGTLAIARGAESAPLLEGPDDVGQLGSTPPEAGQLPGG